MLPKTRLPKLVNCLWARHPPSPTPISAGIFSLSIIIVPKVLQKFISVWEGGRQGGREEEGERMKCEGVARKPGFAKRAKEQTNQVCKEYEEKEAGGGAEERERERACEREKCSKSDREREK